MTPFYQDQWATLYDSDCRDVLRSLPANSVHMVVTSPPYWAQREYEDSEKVLWTDTKWEDGWIGQLGREPHYTQYITHMLEVFQEIKRVLRPDGTVWLNLGSKYSGSGIRTPEHVNPGISRSAERASLYKKGKGPEIVSISPGDETFALKDDLSVEELAYVLTELAKFIKRGEVAVPNFSIGVNPAVAPNAETN